MIDDNESRSAPKDTPGGDDSQSHGDPQLPSETSEPASPTIDPSPGALSPTGPAPTGVLQSVGGGPPTTTTGQGQTSRPSPAKALGIEDYLDATSDASGRTRSAAYTLLVASVLMFASLLNSNPWNWMGLRLEQFRETQAKYVEGVLGARPSTDDGMRRWDDQKAALHSSFLRLYAENSLVAKVPFLGFSFDVNYLGVLGGVALYVLLMVLQVCISREGDNLRLAFRKAEDMGKLGEFYQVLGMRQVLTIPPGTAVFRSRIQGWAPFLFVMMPAIVYGALCWCDYITRDAAYLLMGVWPVRILIFVEIAIFAGIVVITAQVVIRLYALDLFWKWAWRRVLFPTESKNTSGFQAKYNNLVKKRERLESGTENDLASKWKNFWDEYWDLQKKQYESFTRGELIADFFHYWMTCRYYEFNDLCNYNGETPRTKGEYKAAWSTYKEGKNPERFITYMDNVFTGNASSPVARIYRSRLLRVCGTIKFRMMWLAYY